MGAPALSYQEKLESAAARIAARIERVPFSDCHYWTGSTNEHGYGVLSLGRKTFKAHRVAHEIASGGNRGGCVLHRCDTPCCVNPAHLFLGTQADNMTDRARKGRAPRGEGHHNAKLTLSDVHSIREMARTTSQSAIAKFFGVVPSTISMVVRRKLWPHA